MLSVMKQLENRKKFKEEVEKAREEERAKADDNDLPPVFNKRLFSAQVFSIITNFSG